MSTPQTESKTNGGNKPVTPPLGAAAAAQATGTASKTDAPKTDAKKPEGERAARVAKEVFIVEGTFHRFASARDAEVFLNSPTAPKEYKVLKGNEVAPKQKTSLR